LQTCRPNQNCADAGAAAFALHTSCHSYSATVPCRIGAQAVFEGVWLKNLERIENSIDFVALDPGFGEHLYAQLGNRKLLAVIA